jgi:hypothetical protein
VGAVSLFLRRNRRLLAVVGFVLGIARLVLVVVATSHQTTDSCASAGISTAAGREGICVRDFGLDGGKTTYNVVDKSHTLKMPGYDARILASNLSTILVSGNDQADYPDNKGLLVSYDLAVTNTGGTALPFDSSGQDASLSIATTPDRISQTHGRKKWQHRHCPVPSSSRRVQSLQARRTPVGSASPCRSGPARSSTSARQTSYSCAPAKSRATRVKYGFGNKRMPQAEPPSTSKPGVKSPTSALPTATLYELARDRRNPFPRSRAPGRSGRMFGCAWFPRRPRRRRGSARVRPPERASTDRVASALRPAGGRGWCKAV